MAEDAGAVPPVVQEVVSALFCNLCFSRDHNRSICRLVVPAAVAAAEADTGSDGEGDLARPILQEAPAVEDDFIPLDAAAGNDALPAVDALPVSSDEEEDLEELVFEDDLDDIVQAPAAHLQQDAFVPFGDAPDPDSDLEALDAEDLAEPSRPDYVDVYMPFVDLRHFNNLSFAFVNPPQPDSDALILQAADLGCGPDRVALFPSSRGARVAVFSSSVDRENAIGNGPFLGRDVAFHFERHDETDNRFLFEHETLAALSIADFPLEHWERNQIIHSSTPFANPHNIDPVCLTGIDFSAVLVTVKAETITDIPLHLTIKNHCSTGSLAAVTIMAFDDLAPSSKPSDGPDFDPIPEAFSSGDEAEGIHLQGGETYADILQAIGAPPPLVPHGEPSAAALAATAMGSVERALANAPPLPLVWGGPILSKPKSVIVKLRLGFFDVFVVGSKGERAVFRLPLHRLASEPGCKGLIVADTSPTYP
jgi:hypothetical protein